MLRVPIKGVKHGRVHTKLYTSKNTPKKVSLLNASHPNKEKLLELLFSLDRKTCEDVFSQVESPVSFNEFFAVAERVKKQNG